MNYASARLRQGQKWVATSLVGLALCGLVGGVALLYPWPSIPYWAVDFTVYHAAASALAHGGNPYVLADLSACAPSNTTGGILIYAYPPLLAQVLMPLSVLPLESASRVWLAGNLLAAIASVILVLRACRWLPRPAILGLLILGALLFVPSLYTYLSGQASLYALLAVSLGLWLFRQERPAWGGLAWGLAWVKPHVLGFLPYALLLERRWRALMAFAALMLVSLALAAPLLPAWVGAASVSLGANMRGDEFLYQATALAPLDWLGVGGRIARVALMLAGMGALFWLARRDIGWKTFAIAQLTLGLTLAPYSGRSDVALNLAPMLLILSEWRTARGPAWLAIVAWVTPIACALAWALTDLDWLFLPLVWGSAAQWLMVGAAVWTVWRALQSGSAHGPDVSDT